MAKDKEPVRLRSKVLRNGNISLYLDIYDKGVRRYEFLRLYLLPERDAGAKAKNAQTMKIAESVKAQRILSLNSGRYDLQMEGKQVQFFPWFSALAETRGSAWQSTFVQLRRYERRDITFASVTRDWVQGFQTFLANTRLKTNTQFLYFSKLCAAIRKAYAGGILATDALRGIKNIRKEKVQRVFLTLPELRLLAQTRCHDATKRMFLFSCLTGLRYSDCQALQWSQVEDVDNGTRLVFRQQKTKSLEYLDISPQAREYMGERGNGRVFPCLHINSVNYRVRIWAKRAGIDKHISFHCARHTFATLMLSIGTDIFVVSRLLGHADIKTTQIYAHILDSEKRAAVAKIPKI